MGLLDDSFEEVQDATELNKVLDGESDLQESQRQVGQILDWEEPIAPPRAPESAEEYHESGERDEEQERQANAREEYRESGERDEERERRLNSQE
jgi:hypothetical protein